MCACLDMYLPYRHLEVLVKLDVFSIEARNVLTVQWLSNVEKLKMWHKVFLVWEFFFFSLRILEKQKLKNCCLLRFMSATVKFEKVNFVYLSQFLLWIFLVWKKINKTTRTWVTLTRITIHVYKSSLHWLILLLFLLIFVQ